MSAEPPTPPDPTAWGQPISAERQAELQAILDDWNAPGADHDGRKGPFDRTGLLHDESVRHKLTGADVAWLAEQSGRSGTGVVPKLHLEGADLGEAYLDSASLGYAHLDGAHLGAAYLADADLHGVHLEEALLFGAQLEGAHLSVAHLEGAHLSGTHLEGADLSTAHLERANFHVAHLEGANLGEAHMEGAHLNEAHLEVANLGAAHLEGADPSAAHLEGAYLGLAHLEGADLRGAFFDPATDFTNVTWTDPANNSAPGPRLADVRWGGVNLTVVEWERIQTLHDETEAQTRYRRDQVRKRKDHTTRTVEYLAAGRAYRLLFVALRSQGLTAPATRYHFRAEVMDRKALWHRRPYGRWLFSWLLGTFAGYGDYIGRLFLTYAVVIGAFALAMFAFSARLPSPDSIGDALILSVTSFHGRGVQPPGLRLNDVLAALSGVEAVFGLLIEGLFIAAFTRRVTGG